MAGWGWLVGKSDFSENPVVSLDLDLDLDLDLGFVKIKKLFQADMNYAILIHF